MPLLIIPDNLYYFFFPADQGRAGVATTGFGALAKSSPNFSPASSGCVSYK
jgi:hypothetical protein